MTNLFLPVSSVQAGVSSEDLASLRTLCVAHRGSVPSAPSHTDLLTTCFFVSCDFSTHRFPEPFCSVASIHGLAALTTSATQFFFEIQRYVVGEILLQGMSIRLSAAVWRDLTSSFFQWKGASAVRELVRKQEKRSGQERGSQRENEGEGGGGWEGRHRGRESERVGKGERANGGKVGEQRGRQGKTYFVPSIWYGVIDMQRKEGQRERVVEVTVARAPCYIIAATSRVFLPASTHESKCVGLLHPSPESTGSLLSIFFAAATCPTRP